MSRSICIGDYVGAIKKMSGKENKIVVEQSIVDIPVKIEPIVQKSSGSKPETVPREILKAMAAAMLDPMLGKTPSDLGNEIRQQVLLRALAAAEKNGWRLEPIDLSERASTNNDA